MPSKTKQIKRKKDRDMERSVSMEDFVTSLRRLADALESGEPFAIRVKGERVNVPKKAEISIEHEREGSSEELEFQLKWSRTRSRASSKKE